MLPEELAYEVINGHIVTFEEALGLTSADCLSLLKSANLIRLAFKGNDAELCSVINARSGDCSEDCKFCAQSAHYKTFLKKTGIIKTSDALSLAKDVASKGVNRLSLVTSGRTIEDQYLDEICHIIRTLRAETDLHLCASLGIISRDQALLLKGAGISTLHHNLETGRSFFPSVCSTHSYDDRVKTIEAAALVGLNICSGGIIGLGESFCDRIEMAVDLRKLEVNSVPINVLVPIPGTPLKGAEQLSVQEILKTFAIFRFILPGANILYAGGRNSLDQRQQLLGLHGGVNAAISGDLLTTTGSKIFDDLKLFEAAGFFLRSW